MSDSTFIDTRDYSAPPFAQTEGAKISGGASAIKPATPSYTAHYTIKDVSGLPLGFDGAIALISPPARPVSLAVKRVMDIVLSLCALLVLSPLLFVVAAAIKATSRGPVLFHQMRDGLNRRPIRVYKFRSMYCDCCDVPAAGEGSRITPVGRVIRRTNIDELPQLLNILRGEMSLIGPRPHPIGMLSGETNYAELVPHYHQRHTVKPGLSGWAQANGYRGPADDPRLARARIDHDLAYIANFSLWLDLKIIARTVAHEIAGGSGS